MPLDAEQQFRRRARRALREGRNFEARGETNRAILAEVRAEIQKEAARLEPTGLPTEQRALGASVRRAIVAAADQTTERFEQEADALHSRHDQTQRQLEELKAALVPHIGAGDGYAMLEQLRK